MNMSQTLVNWLSNIQKPFAVIAVETVKTDFIYKYIPIFHMFVPHGVRIWTLNIPYIYYRRKLYE